MKYSLQILTFLLGAASCPAQWQLIDNFEQLPLNMVYYDSMEFGWNSTSISGTDQYWTLEDPHNEGNVTLFIEPGDYGISLGTVWASKALPAGGIEPGESATLFLRYFVDSYHTNPWHFGTTDKPPLSEDATNEESASTYSDFNALCKINTLQLFRIRDGNEYIDSNPEISSSAYTWYNLWVIVRNTFIDKMPTGTHEYYIQGPNDASPIQITFGPDKNAEARFNRQPLDSNDNPQPITWIMLSTNTNYPYPVPGTSGLRLLDDIYFSEGINLSNPILYSGYSIDENQNVFTGDFLGWLNVAKSPYIWSYALNCWIYMEEPTTDAPGAWGYIFK